MAGYDNNKLGELRPNQIITTFGPGAIVDAIKDSVTVLDINYWKDKGQENYRRKVGFLSWRRLLLYASNFIFW